MDTTGTPTRLATAQERATPLGSCGKTEVAELIARFLDAFNHGDQDQLVRFFPPQAAKSPHVLNPGEERFFRWYTVMHLAEGKPSLEFVAYNRADLLPYFARRHEQHEQLRLHKLNSGGLGWHGGVDIDYELTRQADDLPPRAIIGKGAIGCASKTIFVWTMGDDSRQSNVTPP